MSEWISVKDKMPDFEDDLLCFIDNGFHGAACTGRFDEEYGFHYPSTSMNSSATLQHVTHWMPLPAPPQK